MIDGIRGIGVVLSSRGTRVGLALLSGVIVTIVFLSWLLTAPLEAPWEADGGTASVQPRAEGDATGGAATTVADTPEQTRNPEPSNDVLPPWPEERLEGQAAKQLVLRSLELVERSFTSIPAYTLTFRKQERIKGKLLPEQTYFVKVRQQPFAVYMKSLHPVQGRELIYSEGQFDNHVIGHPAGLARMLIPRLKVPPDHPLILAESRHPLNRAGLGNLMRKMIGVRRLDLSEPETVTILDRTSTPDGRVWLRSRHYHGSYNPERPFAETSILYDPESRLPLRFTGYDFPEKGQTEKLLGEQYSYDDLKLDVSLTSRDFDPTNPDYGFHRL